MEPHSRAVSTNSYLFEIKIRLIATNHNNIEQILHLPILNQMFHISLLRYIKMISLWIFAIV